MRRYVQIFGLMVLAFAASGWSSMIAAAFCPHANGSAGKVTIAGNATDDKACHPVKPESVSKPDCHDSAMEQEAMGDMEVAYALPDNPGSVSALGLPMDACTHCMGRTELPSSTFIASRNVESKRGLELAAAQTASPVAPTVSFIQPVLYRQGAPPGSTTQKYLLTGILLI